MRVYDNKTIKLVRLRPCLAGLFHKAISQSGVFANPWALTEWTNNVTNMSFRLVEKLGKATLDPKVAYEFLKTIDAKILIEVSQTQLKTEAVSISMFYWLIFQYEFD